MSKLILLAAALLPLPVAAAEQTAVASPADARIAAARKKLSATPDSQSYNDLAFAFCRKARDTSDSRAYNEAAAALKRSIDLSPGNYDARKLLVTVALGRHEYSQALQSATGLNHQTRDDIAVWGLLVDANVALGNYAEAERDAQWILDLRSGSALGFEKAAGLRELFGDPVGAIEFYDEANRRTSQNDADQRAWLLTRKAELKLALGSVKEAEEAVNQALVLYPDSMLAAAALAKVRSAQGRYDEAADLLEKRCQRVSSPANLYAWAEALAKSSHPERAADIFSHFETNARADMAKPDNSNLDLVFFYLDRKNNPAEALAIASRLSAERHDSATLHALAWALYGNGKYTEARTQMDRALEVGIRDPVFFCHAEEIAAKVNDSASVAKFKKELAEFGANACPAEQRAEARIEGKP